MTARGRERVLRYRADNEVTTLIDTFKRLEMACENSPSFK